MHYVPQTCTQYLLNKFWFDSVIPLKILCRSYCTNKKSSHCSKCTEEQEKNYCINLIFIPACTVALFKKENLAKSAMVMTTFFHTGNQLLQTTHKVLAMKHLSCDYTSKFLLVMVMWFFWKLSFHRHVVVATLYTTYKVCDFVTKNSLKFIRFFSPIFSAVAITSAAWEWLHIQYMLATQQFKKKTHHHHQKKITCVALALCTSIMVIGATK